MTQPDSGTTALGNADMFEFRIRCISVSDSHSAVIMPDEGWGALLDCLREVRGQSRDLDEYYRGLKEGLGFRSPEEMLRPAQPAVES